MQLIFRPRTEVAPLIVPSTDGVAARWSSNAKRYDAGAPETVAPTVMADVRLRQRRYTGPLRPSQPAMTR